MSKGGKRRDTRLVEAGRRREWTQGLVNVPVTRTSTVLFDDVASMEAARPARLGTLSYGLQGTPAQWSLAEALTELEPGAAGTALVPTGLAAITAALTAVLSSSDELLVVDSVYGPTRRFCDTILKRLGVTTRYYPPTASPDELADMVGAQTRAVFLESPGSQTFEVQDVPGICAMARDRGLVTLLDNTWATPLFFPALARGVDISLIACTKYVGGHSDLMLGAITASADWYERIQTAVFDLGHAVSPDDAWLAARGLRTLALRMRRHEASALRIARWIAEQPQVERVLHPALESCPGHEFWKRDFSGSSSLFAFSLADGGRDRAVAFVEALELFGIGYSFGGFESLALPLQPIRTVSDRPHSGLVRLHVGLEDPDDLIADLAAAFRRIHVDR